MKNLLITGGAGFIGSNFIHYLIRKTDYNIINYDKLTYAGNLNNLKGIASPRYAFVKGDINDFNLLDDLVIEKKVDTIVNFAAETHVDRSIDNSDIFLETNVLGTNTLLKIAKKHNLRFHHISTDEVFGELKHGEPKFNEKSNYLPNSPYAASKAASDHLVRAFYKTFNLKATISNCCNNYGPYQYPEKVIPLFITNLLKGKKIPLYGDGQNIRSWLYVEEHCKAVLLILEKGKIGETYCVGGEAEITNLELARKILKVMGFNENMIDFVKDRPGHDFRYAIDDNKIRTSLGWKSNNDFDKRLEETIKWYKENKWWWEPLKTKEE